VRPDVEVRLRELRESDLPCLHRWYQTPELWDHLVGDFTERSEAEAVSYMRRWLLPSEHELRLGIELSTADGWRLVGLAFFAPLDRTKGHAELHTMIGEPSERGRGVGRRAVAALMDRGFAMGLRRIELRVLQTNAAARRLYEACGFQAIGHAAPVIKHGRQVEVLRMAVDQPRSATT